MIRRRWEALPIAWQYAATAVMCAAAFALAFAVSTVVTGAVYGLTAAPSL